MSVSENFKELISERLDDGVYSKEEYDYIRKVYKTIDDDLKEDVEFVLNVIDLYDELLEDTKRNSVVPDIVEKNREILEKYVKDGDIFATPLIDHIRDENQKEIKLMKGSEVGTKGITKCKKCHLDNITFYSKQKAKGDEGETLFLTCLDCGFKWNES